MRTLLRSLLLFTCVCWVTAIGKTQPAPGGGYNFLTWVAGYPKDVGNGQVDLKFNITPTTKWSCTSITCLCIENESRLGMYQYVWENPETPFLQPFQDLMWETEYEMCVDATFQKGAQFDFKTISAVLTPK